MADRLKSARHRLETAGFRLLVGIVRRLPRARALALGAAVGHFTFDVPRIRRRVAIDNILQRLEPTGGQAEAVRIARESYGVIARAFVDLIRNDLETEDRIWKLVRREELDEVVRVWKRGRGGMLISGHFGSWELMVTAVRRLGVPVGAMAKDQSNRAVNETLRDLRARGGITPLSPGRGLREALQFLRDGGYVATLLDQDAGRKGIFVDFLGVPTSTHAGAVEMAVRTGAPLVVGVLIDRGGGDYRIDIGPTWWPPKASDRPEREVVREGVEHFTRFLEERVRAHPGNYFWAHRRWKTRPPEPNEPNEPEEGSDANEVSEASEPEGGPA